MKIRKTSWKPHLIWSDLIRSDQNLRIWYKIWSDCPTLQNDQMYWLGWQNSWHLPWLSRLEIHILLSSIFYKNHELLYKSSFKAFLMQINDSLQMKQTNDEVLILVNLITDRYLGLSVYIATLGSWSNGFMHYDQTPNICFSWSRSHAFGKIKNVH